MILYLKLIVIVKSGIIQCRTAEHCHILSSNSVVLDILFPDSATQEKASTATVKVQSGVNKNICEKSSQNIEYYI